MHAPDDLALPGGSPAAQPQPLRRNSAIVELLDAVISAAPRPVDAPGVFRVDDFLAEPDTGAALRAWFRVAPSARFSITPDEILDRLTRDIAELDARLTDQLNAIMHHPAFQKLEASWRGLIFLAEQCAGQRDIKLRVLSLGWKELSRDLDRAIEFDQSQFFNKIYSEEFGSPGGEPYGVILGDYEISHRVSADHPNDSDALEALSHIAAAAFAPMVMAAHPSLFGLDEFAALGTPLNLPRTFQQLEYLRWHRIRDEEDSRFIGLVLPHVLMRAPYQEQELPATSFRFSEQVAGPDNRSYLWGSAVYALGAVLVREFAQTGWLASIQGVERGIEAGGLVTGLPLHHYGTDAEGVEVKYSTDVLISDSKEKELGELGFMPLCFCKDTPWSAFYGSASVQKPKLYQDVPATVNARLSSMLQYMFCVSRFAHYLKVIGRDRVGSFSTAQECQNFLQRWLHNYTIASDDASIEAKAKAPLREGRVEVRERPGRPGSYYCVMHLRPHFQLDQVVTAVRLVTELSPGN